MQLDGLLHVSAPLALGRGELIGFVSGFLARHPRIKIELVITIQFLDLVTSHVDVAIRFGELTIRASSHAGSG